MTGRTIEELVVGDSAETTRVVTAETVREFVEATGDRNPLHSDPAFAATTRFGRVIAPGLLSGGLLSAVIGTRLPGPGVVYLSQSLKFLKPVHLGDAITARVEVSEVIRERNRLCLRTICVNQEGAVVLEGEAWVMPPKARVEYAAGTTTPRRQPVGAYTPAAFGIQVMSLWVAGGLALAEEAVRLCRLAIPRPGEADPVRS